MDTKETMFGKGPKGKWERVFWRAHWRINIGKGSSGLLEGRFQLCSTGIWGERSPRNMLAERPPTRGMVREGPSGILLEGPWRILGKFPKSILGRT